MPIATPPNNRDLASKRLNNLGMHPSFEEYWIEQVLTLDGNDGQQELGNVSVLLKMCLQSLVSLT